MVVISGHGLKIDDLIRVSRYGEKVEIDGDALKRVDEYRDILLKNINAGKRIYGVNTGVGAFINKDIGREDARLLQKKVIMSHAAGVGERLDDETVRGIMLLRANSLLRGNSGVRSVIIKRLVDFLNKNIIPIVPSRGSVGASGDLAPLAHIALAITGMGKVKYRGDIVDARKVLESVGSGELNLDYKEGIALINGTQVMTAITAICLHDARTYLLTALAATALTLESLGGIMNAYMAEVHALRPHKGQILVASAIRELLKGSDCLLYTSPSPRDRG